MSIINTTVEEQEEYIDSGENEEEVEGIRKYTLSGRPLGTKEFIAKSGKE